MPVIRLFSPAEGPGPETLGRLADDVTALLGLPAGHCWVWWQRLEPGSFHRPEWAAGSAAPAGIVVCKESYGKAHVNALLRLLRRRLAELLEVPADEIYLVVQRAAAGELLVRGEVWAPEPESGAEPQRRPGPESGAQPDSRQEPESGAQPETRTGPKTKPRTRTEATPEPQTRTEATPEPQTPIEATPEPQTPIEATPEPQTRTEATPEPQTPIEATPEPQTRTEAETEPQTRTEAETEPVPHSEGAITDVEPVARVHNERREITDDDWGSVHSVIRLDAGRFTADALLALDSFSHVEVVFRFHRVPPHKVETAARHPRGNPDWPRAGIFAQRGKNRPNRIGVSRCRLLKVDGLDVHVAGLDAVDGTPVLDIKPYLRQFGPREEVVQPEWVDELMRHYY
jgi:tRNA (Thr-GGU) A37 N-methylase